MRQSRAPTLSGKLTNNDNGNFVAANFTGHTYDTVLDIYFAETRFYDANNRQWMSSDPIKDGLNWYQYVGANPTTYFDPTGLYGAREDGNNEDPGNNSTVPSYAAASGSKIKVGGKGAIPLPPFKHRTRVDAGTVLLSYAYNGNSNVPKMNIAYERSAELTFFSYLIYEFFVT